MSDPSLPSDATSVIAQEFKVDEPCALEVDLPGAYVRLRPGSSDTRVEVNISMAGCPPDRAEQILDRLSVGTRQTKDRVRVYSDRPRWDAEWWRWVRQLSATVHLDVHLPTHVDATIRASGGTIDAADLAGHLEVESLGGKLQINGLEGTLDLRTRSSDVSVTQFDGSRIDIHSAAGKLSLKEISSDSLTVRSVSAPVTLTNVTGTTDIDVDGASLTLQELSGPCTARTQGGALTYVGTPSDDTELSALGAPLEAQLPASLSATLDLSGEEIFLDEAFSFEGERTPHHVQGALNGGGPALRLRAVRGAAHCQTQ